MKKKITFVTLVLALFGIIFLPKTAAAGTQVRIDDQAQLLGGSIPALQQQAQELANKTKAGVFVVTTDNNSQTPHDFSENYLADKIGAGNNGIVLLVDMGQRQVYIWATGNLKYYMTKSRINSILDVVQPQLTDGNFAQAIRDFYSQVEHFYSQGIPGNRAYTVNPETGEVTFHRSIQPVNVLIAAVVALVTAAAFAILIISRYQLKIGAKWRYAYQENGKLKLTTQQDILTNTFVTTRRIPRNNNSSGSGGGSFSGGSGGGRGF